MKSKRVDDSAAADGNTAGGSADTIPGQSTSGPAVIPPNNLPQPRSDPQPAVQTEKRTRVEELPGRRTADDLAQAEAVVVSGKRIRVPKRREY